MEKPPCRMPPKPFKGASGMLLCMMRIVLFLSVCVGFCCVGSTVLAAEAPTSTSVSVTSTASSVATTSPVTSTEAEPLILQMADGRFYAPSIGLTRSSREALLRALAGKGEPEESIVPTSTVQEPLFALGFAIREARQTLKATTTRENTLMAIIWNTETATTSLFDAVYDSKEGWVIKNGSFLADIRGTTKPILQLKQASSVILVVRYDLHQKNLKMKKGKIIHGFFTPMQKAFQTPEMIAFGQTTLDEWIERAYAITREKGIMSRASTTVALADYIDPILIRSLLFIEHTDLASMQESPQKTYERFLLTIATQQESAYATDLSSVGATGLGQFMSGTYASLVKHKDFGLPADFVRAMEDPHVVIRAQIAYADSLIAELPAEVKEAYHQDLARAGEYIAAAYNAGTSRVAKALPIWDQAVALVLKKTPKMLAKEDDNLVDKIEALKAQRKTAIDPKKQKTLDEKIAMYRKQRKELAIEIEKVKNIALFKETRDYVKKFRIAYQRVQEMSLLSRES